MDAKAPPRRDDDTYDDQDHLKTVNAAEGNLTTYTYDEHGELVTTTDARGDRDDSHD